MEFWYCQGKSFSSVSQFLNTICQDVLELPWDSCTP